jgi:TfoX/Sxy family transcriptional regulator of competence genes
MAYDEELAARFRAALAGMAGISEKRMMGGVCFFLNGNMIGGADRTKTGERRFMFRVGKENEAAALALPGATILEQGGRRMSGLIFVDESLCDDEAMRRWLSPALGFVSGLPPK